MAMLHHGGGGSNIAHSIVLLLFGIVVLLTITALATPRFVEQQQHEQQQRRVGARQDANDGQLDVQRSTDTPNGSAARYDRKHIPEALKRFNFNARSGSSSSSSSNSNSATDNAGITTEAVLDPSISNGASTLLQHISQEDVSELADIALIVTADGSIHAIKRDTGIWVWSLHDENTQKQRQEIFQSPLVRSSARNGSQAANSTGPPKSNGQDQDEEGDEIYIIEPHSAGDIYVYHKTTGKLQRLPLSVTQLVELSPFTFPVKPSSSSSTIEGEDSINTDDKLFVGRKESKLVGIDLKSGKLVGVFGPEAGWCEWPQDVTSRNGGAAAGSPAPNSRDSSSSPSIEEGIESRPRDLLYLGQTDYHISIYSKTQGLLQTLSFTSYGPSNLGGSPLPFSEESETWQHLRHQHNTDGRYIQPMHDGSLICLHPEKEGIQWTNRFSHPVVSIFDIWYPAPSSSSSSSSSASMQPSVSMHPHHKAQNQLDELSNLPSSTFIGKLTRPPFSSSELSSNGSSLSQSDVIEYYAMSSTHFPLVSFAPASLTPGPGTEDSQKPTLDIVGSHKVEEPLESGNTIEGTTPPLSLDPVPSPPLIDQNDTSPSRIPTLPPGTNGDSWPSSFKRLLGMDSQKSLVSPLESVLLLCGLFAIAFAFFRSRMASKRVGTNRQSSKSKTITDGRNENIRPKPEVTYTAPDSLLENGIIPLSSESTDSSSGSNGGNASEARWTPSHVTSPSLDKALPALPPVEEGVDKQVQTYEPVSSLDVPMRIVETHPSDEEDAEEAAEDADKIRNPKKGRRRKRGGKRNANKENGNTGTLAGKSGEPLSQVNGNSFDVVRKDLEGPEQNLAVTAKTQSIAPVDITPAIVAKDQASSGRIGSLEISDNVIGYGSHGTVVLKGTFQGRAVAVKRLLKDFVSVASHEVSLLQESDDHPNVIRYFYKESHENFHYIALELCPTSLYELIDTPSAFPTLIKNFDPVKALKQMTRGLAHLHKLKIVHRDLKPQNILVATTPGPRSGDAPVVRLVISDFGLCKKLDLDESSFLQSTKGGGNHAPGSFGYRAPEVLRGEVDANDLVNNDGSPNGTQNGSSSVSSRSASTSSTTTVAAGEAGKSSGRKLTRAIDIFSMGCIFYFVLTMGEHPFGSRYEREINILNGKIGLDGLDVMTEGKHEAKELIASMCGADARNRPTAHDILLHPLFWSSSHSLHFLCDASDRFEIMEQENVVLSALETTAPEIVGQDWLKNLDRNLIDNLGKYRKYNAASVRDLLRVMRNKKHHYQDLPENVRRSLGEPPAGFLSYFTKRFPKLLLHVHSVVRQFLAHEPMFTLYFDHDDS